MADQSDVETALVELAAAALYPSGSTGPSAVGPVCRIYRGWPVPAALDADLAAGQINVTVYAVDAPAKTTTRYPSVWTPTAQSVPTLTASVSGVTAAFEGTAGAGQIAGIAVDGRTYVYRTTASDTPDSVAANLATLVNADRIALLAGSTVTVPGAGTLLARAVADVPAVQEVRRQERDFRVICWCPSPDTRDATASCIDLALAAIHFVSLPDGSSRTPAVRRRRADRPRRERLAIPPRSDLPRGVSDHSDRDPAEHAVRIGNAGHRLLHRLSQLEKLWICIWSW